MMQQSSISVIIPIYNAEATLHRCVDSVLAQTERELEVLLIDDGSEDESGAIADGYAAKDPRVRVFHKENGGLSSARNYGLDRATGDYIAFVDADDWIEPETYETALAFCEDLCIFGYLKEYRGKTQRLRPADMPEVIGSGEGIRRLIQKTTINHSVWNKLYRKKLFENIRFPEGCLYEDIRTTYKLLQKADRIALIPHVFYHYVQYRDSIVHNMNASVRLDRWTAMHELYRAFGTKGEAFRTACVRNCAYPIFWAWGSLWKADENTLEKERERIREIRDFAKENRKVIANRADCPLHISAGLALAARGSRPSMLCAYLMQKAARLLKPMRLYQKTQQKAR